MFSDFESTQFITFNIKNSNKEIEKGVLNILYEFEHLGYSITKIEESIFNKYAESYFYEIKNVNLSMSNWENIKNPPRIVQLFESQMNIFLSQKNLSNVKLILVTYVCKEAEVFYKKIKISELRDALYTISDYNYDYYHINSIVFEFLDKDTIAISTYNFFKKYIEKIYCFMEGYISLNKFENYLYSINNLNDNKYYIYLLSYDFTQKNAENLLKNDIAEWVANIKDYNLWLFLVIMDCILDEEISIYNGLREISIVNLEENLMPIELTGYLSLLDNEPERHYKEDIFELIVKFRKTIIKSLTT